MNNEKLIFSIVKKATPYNQDRAWSWEDPAVSPRQEPFAPSSQSFVSEIPTNQQKMKCTSCGYVFDSGNKERSEITTCPQCSSTILVQV
jgi:DNA-directed RNA polymerase subunit RPC12/RpoP